MQNPVDEAEAVENLEGTALQAIRLPVEDFGSSFVDDSGFDAGPRRPSSGQKPIGRFRRGFPRMVGNIPSWTSPDDKQVTEGLLVRSHGVRV